MQQWRLLLVGLSLWAMACGPKPPPAECTSPADCDDSNECTDDLCDQGTCKNTADNSNIPAQVSTLDCKKEVCSGGLKSQIPDDTEQPDDNVPCTDDVCSGGAPVFTANDGGCGAPSDCRDLVCDPQGLQGVPDANGCSSIIDDLNLPDDGADCTADSCLNGAPVFAPNNAVCDTGATGCAADTCDPNNAGSDPVTGCVTVLDNTFCDDSNFCTNDACDPTSGTADANGCVITANAGQPTQIPGNCQTEICNNGNPSTSPDINDVPTADVDGFSCTISGCDAAGNITETPTNNLCDDQLSCTKDTCNPADLTADPATGCTAEAQADQCALGQACDPGADPATTATGCVDADVCPPVLFAVQNGSVSGSTAALTDDISLSCADNTGAHPDLAFALDLAADSDVLIQATSQDGHALAVGLVDLSGGACGAELLCADGNPSVASLNIVNIAAGSYAIIIDGSGATQQDGAFTLDVIVGDTSIQAGDLVINEFHPDPSAVGDAVGEFLELANPNGFIVGTIGLGLSETGGASPQTILGAGATQLFVPAGGFLVGARSTDIATNGGIDADFQLTLSLNNTPNENFRLEKPGIAIVDDLNTTTIAFGTATAGRSFQVDRNKTSAALNDLLGAWCKTATTTTYGAGDHGTPGTINDVCSPPSTVCIGNSDCNDNNPCTDDLCNAGTCTNPNNNSLTPPDDGFDCTVESCNNGVASSAPDNSFCDVFAEACVIDICDPANENTGDGSGCFIAGDDAFCSDGNFCTDDICDPFDPGSSGLTGCVNPAFSGTPPAIVGNCQQEVCSNGNPSSTPDINDVPTADVDGVSCTVEGCNAAGQITETPNNNLCDDQLSCTQDTCNAVTDCQFTANNNLCLASEFCDANADPATTSTGCVLADTCPGTIPANPNGTVSNSTIGFNNDFALSCANNTGAHPDLAFSLDLAVDSDVLLAVEPTAGQQVSVAIVEISNGTCGRELLCGTQVGIDAQLSVINLKAGSYAIVVDGNGATAQSGAFDLTVLSDPTAIAAGDLVINEMLANPRTLLDANAEFVEIANPDTTSAISTSGLTFIEDDGSPLTQTLTTNGIDGPQLIIPAGGFLLGVPTTNTTLNGGLTPNFDLIFGLNNTPNENFQIMKGSTLIDQVNLPAGGFPTATDGVSVQLDLARKNATLNDAFANWCLTPNNVYDATNNNKGTPGINNESCGFAPACTIATQATDCNDNNPCTDDLCVASACQNVNDNTNTPTPDAFFCTIDSCSNGAIVSTPSNLLCDDSVICTNDVCVGAGGDSNGCTFTADNNNCLANEFCDPVNDCSPIAGFCGDGNIDAGEQCDGANLNNQSCTTQGFVSGTLSCNASCQFNTAACVGAVCGNGVVETGETCDDSNTTAGDGCNATCATETGFNCTGAPSSCSAICGDNLVLGAETCDDGNTTADGNGCSATCFVTHLVINEVDYDQIGTDSNEYIEIFNGTGADVNLSGLKIVLVNGSSVPGAPYTTVDLTPGGTLPAGGFLVIGSTTLLNTITANVEIAFGLAANNIQNGNPDGIALIDDTNNILIDALAYGGSMLANLSTFGIGAAAGVSLTEGTALAATDSNTVDGSLSRHRNGRDNNNANTDWIFTASKTPGLANP